MEQTFTIPEGYEIRQTGDNSFAIVQKELQPDIEQENDSPINNSFFGNDFEEDANEPHKNDEAYYESLYSDVYNEDGSINEERYNKKQAAFKKLFETGEISKLNRHEMDLLKFCHETDMKSFLKEEFEKHPINLKHDANGYIYAEH